MNRVPSTTQTWLSRLVTNLTVLGGCARYPPDKDLPFRISDWFRNHAHWPVCFWSFNDCWTVGIVYWDNVHSAYCLRATYPIYLGKEFGVKHPVVLFWCTRPVIGCMVFMTCNMRALNGHSIVDCFCADWYGYLWNCLTWGTAKPCGLQTRLM